MVFFHGVTRKAFQGPKHGRMWWGWFGWKSEAAPRFPKSPLPSVPLQKKFSLIFKGLEEGPVSRYLALLSQSMFLPPWLSFCFQLCSGPLEPCPGPRQLPGPPGERMHKRRSECVLPSKLGVTVNLWLYHLRLRKDQAPFQTNQSTSQSLAGSR